MTGWLRPSDGLLLWPAFLGACVLELIVFAVVDPHELHWGGEMLGWSRSGVYTIAFFVFWAVQALAVVGAVLLSRAPGRSPEPPRDVR